MHSALATAVPRARGGERRRRAEAGEPLLGRGAGALRPCRRGAVDAPAAALGADVAPRRGADRARAPARAGLAGRDRPSGRRGARRRQRLGAAPRAGPLRLRPPDDADQPRGSRGAGGASELQRHRARGLRVVLLDLVRRAAALAAPDRRRGRREAARVDRAHRAAPLLRRSAQGGRHRSRRGGARRGSRAVPAPVPRRGPRRRPAGAHRPRAPRAARAALARPGALRARRGGGRDPARPAPFRGRLRNRALGARAPARPRPGRLLALGEDRPHRRRPVQRPRDRVGLQVGEDGVLGGEDRLRAAASDPALHARPARPRRDRAARGALPGARGGRRRARAPARHRARGRGSGVPEERLPRRGRVLGPDRPGRRARARVRRVGSGRATSRTTRSATAAARRGATSRRSAG